MSISNKIKAVFFDIDGTLVSFKTHQVSTPVIRAIHELRKKGVKIFIATGRHYKWINNLDDLEIDGYVTLNGGYCLTGEGKVIYRHFIPHEDFLSMLDYQRNIKSFPCVCVTEDSVFLNYKNETVEKLYQQVNMKVPDLGPIETLTDKNVYQLVAFFTVEEESEIMSQLPGCISSRWSPCFSDVVAKGCSKAVGIDRIIEHYGISLDETMAFGDGGNDTAMIQHAAIGVAMGNASDDVKEKADFVTRSVDEDGIVYALKHYDLL